MTTKQIDRLLRLGLRERYKKDFLDLVPPCRRLLDVGCGNDSAKFIKGRRPDLYYVGLDIGEYNNSKSPAVVADEYIVCEPAQFAETISALHPMVDAIVSSHNIEHCSNPQAVLNAMLNILAPSGLLFMSFPSNASERFPSRKGTLNFWDDETHQKLPDFDAIVKTIKARDFDILFSAERYRPIRHVIYGLINEYQSRRRNHTMRGTWALYGFESIIWAKRR